MPDFVKATPMTSRSPAKAPTTREQSDRLAAETGAMVEFVLGLQRHAAALCIATACLFLAMTGLEFLYFQQLSGGLPSLDLRFFGFTPDEAMVWLTALGRRGSEIIIVWHYLTFDLVFPALFSLALMSLLLVSGNALPRFAAVPERMQAVFALVLVLPYTLFDYAQNIAVVRLLSDFLSANPDSLAFASTLIVCKFVFGVIPVIVIAAFLLAGRKKQ
ncbi:hypothetical protein [Mesorhizobium sp. BE184]|uniref:hypothetical protein n=1 Tax=Mesorhizobium sp. BE184 TaxID=2817714 RepID=UPI0028624846|nr:hypothetical protein [Mesorhizobium sp. BE184]MDR7032328.1 hypothetical protein [Mesorhizobium sp. BE184]